MNALLSLIAPLALLLPTAVGQGETAVDPRLTPPGESTAPGAADWLPLDPPTETPAFDQVRIEQRVIIRISPRGSAVRPSAFADMTMAPPPPRLVERRMGNCIPVSSIAGVEPRGDNQLLLFLADHSLALARLDKSCNARDYYAGFYLERTRDGQMCVNRDKIHSRAGSNCSISSLHRLVDAGG